MRGQSEAGVRTKEGGGSATAVLAGSSFSFRSLSSSEPGPEPAATPGVGPVAGKRMRMGVEGEGVGGAGVGGWAAGGPGRGRGGVGDEKKELTRLGRCLGLGFAVPTPVPVPGSRRRRRFCHFGLRGGGGRHLGFGTCGAAARPLGRAPSRRAPARQGERASAELREQRESGGRGVGGDGTGTDTDPSPGREAERRAVGTPAGRGVRGGGDREERGAPSDRAGWGRKRDFHGGVRGPGLGSAQGTRPRGARSSSAPGSMCPEAQLSPWPHESSMGPELGVRDKAQPQGPCPSMAPLTPPGSLSTCPSLNGAVPIPTVPYPEDGTTRTPTEMEKATQSLLCPILTPATAAPGVSIPSRFNKKQKRSNLLSRGGIRAHRLSPKALPPLLKAGGTNST